MTDVMQFISLFIPHTSGMSIDTLVVHPDALEVATAVSCNVLPGSHVLLSSLAIVFGVFR